MKKAKCAFAILALALGFCSCNLAGGNAGVSGTISGTVTWSAATVLSGAVSIAGNLTIAKNVTVACAGQSIEVTGSLTVEEGATLANVGDLSVNGAATIGKGVTVTGADDAVIDIGPEAVFSATGTADALAVFKAAASAGWGGFYFENNSDSNALAYCDISGAGSAGSFALSGSSAGGQKIAVSHCLIHDNIMGGVDARWVAKGCSVSDTRFYGNGDLPAIVNQNLALDSTNAFAKSGESAASSSINCVRFFGDIDAERSVVFDITEVPYYLSTDGPTIVYGAMTVNKGVTFWMGDHARLEIAAGGKLLANGEAGATIGFLPRQSGGTWDQVYFDESSIDNALAYCDFSGGGGGSSELYVLECYSTGETGVEADIDHCRFFDNDAGGISANYDQDIAISNCAFGDNGDDQASGPYDILYHAEGVSLANNSSIAGTNGFTTLMTTD